MWCFRASGDGATFVVFSSVYVKMSIVFWPQFRAFTSGGESRGGCILVKDSGWQRKFRMLVRIWCARFDLWIPKLSLEIRNSNTYRRLPTFLPFLFIFSLLSFHILGFWFFFRRFVRFLHRFKTSKHMQNEKKQNRFGGRKTQPTIILEKAVMLHALEHAGIFRWFENCVWNVFCSRSGAQISR